MDGLHRQSGRVDFHRGWKLVFEMVSDLGLFWKLPSQMKVSSVRCEVGS